MRKFFVVFCQKNIHRPQIFKTIGSARKKKIQEPELQLQEFKNELEAEKFVYPKKISYLLIQQKIRIKEQQENPNTQIENQPKQSQLSEEDISQGKQIEQQIKEEQKSLFSQFQKMASEISMEQIARERFKSLYVELFQYQGAQDFIKTTPIVRVKAGTQYIAQFDGCSKGNPGKSGIGYIVFNKQNKTIFSNSINIGKKTNNEAQFFALVYLLLDCKQNRITNLSIYGDSQLVVKGVNQQYNIASQNLKYLNSLAKYLIKSFDQIKIQHVQRKYNKLADKLSNDGIKKKYKGSLLNNI